MGPPGSGWQRDRGHLRPRPGGPRRCGLCRAAGDRQAARRRPGSRGGRVGEGRLGHLRAGFRHRHSRQRRADRLARAGQRGPVRPVVLPPAAERCVRAGQAARRGRLPVGGRRRLIPSRPRGNGARPGPALPGLRASFAPEVAMSESPRLVDLQSPAHFLNRHLGPDEAEQLAMLQTLGLDSLDQLIEEAVPPTIRYREPLALPEALDEQQALARRKEIASRNQIWTSLIGMGYYGTVTPPVILRNVLENPGWYTAYTPYQPEVSQGRLEALLNFQQLTIDLTGLDLA